jgi:glucose/arabinose dehydrogenase
LTLALLGVSIASPPGPARATIFNRDVLTTLSTSPTSIAFGPDGRLYVASETQIVALTLDTSGENVVGTETIATGQTGILGIAFDPTAPASPVEVYASRQNLAATDGYEGVVSTYTAPSWTRADVITGLPSSRPFTNHFTNGLAFDSTGRLFMAQGSNTDAGLSGPYYPETPLSAAILYADVNAMGFDGAITYNPSTTPANDNVDQTGGDVFVYAPGTRNPFDLVVHSNGRIYASDNGPGGPNTSTSCTMSGTGVNQADELNLIEQNDYYGFPNRNRGRADPRQCIYRAPELGNGLDFTAPIQVLPAHCSCDGLAEYTSPVLGTGWQGNLLLAQFILGNVARIELSGDGLSVLWMATLESGFDLPLDVTVGPGGTIYVAEYGANRISFLAPVTKGVGGLAGVPDVRPPDGGATSWGWLAAVTIAAAVAAVMMGRCAPRR